jgi:predicted GIY-YIG superfamily endonuclease
MSFYAYMLKCSDESYYIGHTDNLRLRMFQHQSGKFEGYTAARLPVELVWSQVFHSRDSAFHAERKIKGWSRRKKEALIKGDWAMISLLSNYKKE